mgnify:CR=1 FL=1
MKRLGLYIHIPFCDRICNYCDFTAFQGANSKIKEYVEALKKEINLVKQDILIEVDGGMSKETAPIVANMGANVIVAGSSIFNTPDRKQAITEIRNSIIEVNI